MGGKGGKYHKRGVLPIPVVLRCPTCGIDAIEYDTLRAKLEQVEEQAEVATFGMEGLGTKLAAAHARIEELEGVLMEIAVGKTADDNTHPMGKYASMAFRYHHLARQALADKEPTP